MFVKLYLGIKKIQFMNVTLKIIGRNTTYYGTCRFSNPVIE